MSASYVGANRSYWNEIAPEYAARADAQWRCEVPEWGIWGIPESEVQMLAGVEGKDVLEAGCGTGYVSAWAAARGARPVGLDNSPAQLGTARRMQLAHDRHFPLVHGTAERLPFPEASFDVVLSEYGAAIWSDPHLWIPEAARVLRPGGELAFLGNSALLMMCMPDLDADLPAPTQLLRNQFGMHRFEWPDDSSVEFHLPHGEMIDLLRGCGLEVLELRELQAPESAQTSYDFVTLEWARRWPCEEVWRARKKD
jgi:SAM-dependent methyltransferase